MAVQLDIDPSYGEQDADTLMFLRHFDEPERSDILELGAHEEDAASILHDNGHVVTGYDLRPRPGAKYFHFARDFVKDYEQIRGHEEHIILYDCAFSTSAIEHFGLDCYGGPVDSSYDYKAMEGVYNLLKPGGKCYLTVPYGKSFAVEPNWRVYDHDALQKRIIQRFEVLTRIYFKSGDTMGVHVPDERVWDGIPIVSEQDANRYDNPRFPHLSIFLKMRKPGDK